MRPPAAVEEDVEDLKAQVAKLTAELKGIRETLAAGADEATGEDADEEEAPEDGEPESEEDEWQYPPFIALLEGDLRDEELRALAEWVEGVLVPGYLGEASADARWCHRWLEHQDAVLWLHGLWLAWQELTDPVSCGYTGPSVWHRDHYLPAMNELRKSSGTFQGCTKGEHSIAHRLPGRVPSAWWYEDSEQ
ncbi:DUF4913 domain-containing protein [Kitasatospora aureofaciens]|uniref:DUF4913 domain-containing protein n=1 Tax=Kitasatospora aureofaciens TaxID=1894 RepID=UPI001C46864E|nr:DUF4913 domain-containing protein [Kitasatospora aureofaciens]MBV6700310.1 DUF4913 domain-containing protein [Kitasatospora aureofaciens]